MTKINRIVFPVSIFGEKTVWIGKGDTIEIADAENADIEVDIEELDKALVNKHIDLVVVEEKDAVHRKRE